MQTSERRSAPTEFEVRAKQDGTGGTRYVVEGHAAVFNSLSKNLGGFVGDVAPSAFPPGVALALQFTPFPYLLYFPVSIYLGRVAGPEQPGSPQPLLHIASALRFLPEGALPFAGLPAYRLIPGPLP